MSWKISWMLQQNTAQFYWVFGTLRHLIVIIIHSCLKPLYIWNSCQVYAVQCVSKIKAIPTIIIYMI